MQVETQLSEGLKRRLAITISAQDFDERLIAKLAQIAGSVRLPGFRPGKVPPAHIKRVHGASVAAEVLSDTVGEYANRAIEQLELSPAYDPQPSFSTPPTPETLLGGGNAITFELELEVMPEIDLGKLSQVTVERPVSAVSEEDVDESVAQFIARYRKFEDRAADAKAEAGDQVTFDSSAMLAGEAYAPLSVTEESTVLRTDDNSPLAPLYQAMVGAKVGDTLKVTIDAPAARAPASDDETDENSTEAAKQKIDLEVLIKKIAAPLDSNADEVAQQVGLEGEVKLRSTLRSQLEHAHEEQSQNRVHRRLLDALSESFDFDLPEKLVQRERESIDKLGENMENQEEEDIPDNAEAEALAQRRVRLGLLFLKFGREESITVEEEDLQREIERQAARMSVAPQYLMQYYTKENAIDSRVRMPAYEAKVVDAVLGKVQLRDVAVSKDELYHEEPSPFAAASSEPTA